MRAPQVSSDAAAPPRGTAPRRGLTWARRGAGGAPRGGRCLPEKSVSAAISLEQTRTVQ